MAALEAAAQAVVYSQAALLAKEMEARVVLLVMAYIYKDLPLA
jgi:hypothetical protein